ncbi:hypothetical protein BDV27DRAFT_122395 [Aspergillus caelatus]|uniref:Uncharacterized protein n=1 Tax=Aspergillus caelatus TaxID=61420 RepID=A0A5N7AH59_9EURO|nr:uncharacterized protein BDV27DRAFT_122395 [Aspergillus caelatus]KAE8368496.1 hypothetical protein BDV27DRAFT_122395 [Aspergillus caelatus]
MCFLRTRLPPPKFTNTVPSLTKDISKTSTSMGIVLTLTSIGPRTGPLIAKTIDCERRRKLFAGADLGRHVIVGRDGCLDRCQGLGLGDDSSV